MGFLIEFSFSLSINSLVIEAFNNLYASLDSLHSYKMLKLKMTILVKLKIFIPCLFSVASHDINICVYISEKVQHEENKKEIVLT
jgi:hypothetical protein